MCTQNQYRIMVSSLLVMSLIFVQPTGASPPGGVEIDGQKTSGIAVLATPPSSTQDEHSGSTGAAERLTLEDCVRIALRQNPLTRVARQETAAAAAAVGEARAPFYPDLNLYTGYRRWETHAFLPTGVVKGDIPSTIGPTNDWSAGLATQYTLFDKGIRRNELRIAQAGRRRTEEDAERIRQDIVLDVHRAFFGLMAALENNRVSREALTRAENHLRLAKERQAVGDVPRADVIRAQVEVADAQLALERAESQVRVSQGQLNTAMGVPVEMSVQVDPKAPETTPPNAIVLSEAVERAGRLRPEARAARERVVAAGGSVNVAKSAYWPKLKGEARYGWRDTGAFPNDKDWSVGVSVDFPLFTGFSRKHKLAGANAELSREEAALERLVQDIQQQVWAAYWQLKEEYEAVGTTEFLVKDAQESLRLAEERYAVGAGTINDLLDAETALAQAEATRVRAEWEYHFANSAFQRSTGELTGS